jgi:outer membrane receptor protein involved in Fe transport
MGQGTFDLGRDIRLKAQAYLSHFRVSFTPRSSLRAFDVWIADFPTFPVTFPVADGQLQLDVPVGGDLLLIAGANLRYIHMHCDTFNPKDIDELRGAGYVHLQWSPWDKLQLTGGLRLDLSSEINPALSPRTVAVLRPWPNHAFRLGYGLAFRKPSLYESQVHGVAQDYNPAVPEIVDKLAEAFGNEGLTNEKVHSFEAGWRGGFLKERLQVSVDLFFNIYQDIITFVVDLEERLGLPDIRNSTIQFENDPGQIFALGGETEVRWRISDSWSVWGNLGVRRVTYQESGERLPSEPTWRINGGFRYAPESGFGADVALHYVSSYIHSYPDPNNILQERPMQNLGETVLLVGRVGYRAHFEESLSVDSGLRIRTPLGNPFREFPGVPMATPVVTGSKSDWCGELVTRLFFLYLRLTF